MPKKFTCDIPTEELKRMYLEDGLTLDDVAKAIGCKSRITVSKLFAERGIDTNRNAMRSLETRHGMSDEEFKAFLIDEYETCEKSLNEISTELGVTRVALRRYFVKYGINLRDASKARSMVSGEKHPRWNGGRNIRNGYVEVYAPDHPKAVSRAYVYEHDLVMEKNIGRYLKDDEVVHHINGNKTDNRIENLQLMTNTEHVGLHARLRHKGDD